MRKAIIAGTSIEDIINRPVRTYRTDYGDVDAAEDGSFVYILRHRRGHTEAPHLINYLANAALLETLEVEEVITTHAVGSISERLLPTSIGLVSDFIDMTYGRPLTFFDGKARPLKHTPMNDVFDDELKFQAIRASVEKNLRISPALTYITTNGPRLESKAEKPSLRVTLYGAAWKKASFLGIPYRKTMALTTRHGNATVRIYTPCRFSNRALTLSYA